MSHPNATFSEVVNAADSLSVSEQEVLLEILRRRIAQKNRDILVEEVAEARAEFQAGKTRASSLSDILDEIRSES